MSFKKKSDIENIEHNITAEAKNVVALGKTSGGVYVPILVASDGTLQISIDNPFDFIRDINVNSDFPTSAEVEKGWFFTISTDVTDNDVSKTNTSQSFQALDEIVWNGTDWTIVGIEYWKRNGTTISPRISGDDLDMLTGDILFKKSRFCCT